MKSVDYEKLFGKEDIDQTMTLEKFKESRSRDDVPIEDYILKERYETEKDKPCNHPGCMHHVTHPCEGCGRIWGRTKKGV